jgi:hypothetical protein
MFKDVESHFQSYFVHFGFWDRRTAWTTSPWGLSWWWSTETDESSIVAWVSNCFNDFTFFEIDFDVTALSILKILPHMTRVTMTMYSNVLYI